MSEDTSARAPGSEGSGGNLAPGPEAAPSTDRQRWLLLIYRISSGSSSRRTYVWRQLRTLGAVYLQQAVAVLPDDPELRVGLDRLGQRIRSTGGEASILETVSPSEAWEAELIARFNATRDEEYAEVVENLVRFEDEIRRETRMKRFLFPELEEGEAEWAKLRRWLARVVDRDFFHAGGRSAAQEALARGQRLLDTFVHEVYRAEGLDEDTSTAPGP
jgi:hypothetical protein